MTVIKEFDNKCWRQWRKRTFYSLYVEVKINTAIMKISMMIHQKLKIYNYHMTQMYLSWVSTQRRLFPRRDTCSSMFIAACFLSSKDIETTYILIE